MRIFSKRKKIYTACFGGYDEKLEAADKYFNEENNPINGSAEHLSPRFMAKLYKILNPFSYDIWIDSSVEIKKRRKFEKLFEGDLCLFKHPFNKNLLEELNLCQKSGYVTPHQRENIVSLYKSAGMELDKTAVYAGGVLFRSKQVNSFNQLWWSLISQYSYRDQLTLPYAINQFDNLKLKVLDLDIYDNEYIKVHKHRKRQ